MKLIRIFFLTILFLTNGVLAFCQTIHVSIFNESPVKRVVVSALKGNYQVIGDSSFVMDLSANDALYLSMSGQKITLHSSSKPVGMFSNIRFEAADTASVLRINPVSPNLDARQYNDNLIVSVAFKRILLVNEVNIDNYVAGVVESEAGANAEPEFYKAQAVLARTYLFGNTDRHTSEGFQLCDGVHCQAYNGRSARNLSIPTATKATKGMVVAAFDSTFITAVFHANCGGETESASNAWLNGKNYLVPVKDPFCINSPAAHWHKTIPLSQWKTYLKSHGFKLPAGTSPGAFDCSQISRKQFYRIGDDSLPFKQIRTDFQLRSSFFSVIAGTEEVTLKGRGFGHGVGLCQEGAMQMAKIGYKYDEILNYYFKNISIVDVNSAHIKKAPANQPLLSKK
ncbi:MAG: SpoIID/LytB domain-containing protein [Bacteroidota bacterium]|nr:SpoIID/LytB domain-containing protein [Bacteroidota bacterium]